MFSDNKEKLQEKALKVFSHVTVKTGAVRDIIVFNGYTLYRSTGNYSG